MKLKPAELCQWEDNGWKRGRVMRDEDGDPVNNEWAIPNNTEVLVKHSITGELEFVPWGNLEIQGEEHCDD